MARLVPYTDYNTETLAMNLHDMVGRSAQVAHLHKRHLWGVVSRYRVLKNAAANVKLAQERHEDGKIEAYAIDIGGLVLGAASVLPDLPLRRQRWPLPPKFGRRFDFLGAEVETTGPNIAAWLDAGEFSPSAGSFGGAALELIYKELCQDHPGAWTIEPLRSPHAVHFALNRALKPVDSGFYDDYESGAHFVPKSTLYVAGDPGT